jgi:hypothetical protein
VSAQSAFVESLERAGWKVPDGYTPDNIGVCRSCDADILWCTTARGRRAPLDPDGKSHFATCPQADGWRRRE